MARWCGATHRQCEKNPDHPIHEIRSYCQQCHDESRKAKFAAMPVKEWSGEPLVIFDGDQYFFDEDMRIKRAPTQARLVLGNRRALNATNKVAETRADVIPDDD